ncbi:ATP-binding protein [Streptomyces umbrinus]|uniref:ATP-binding protein n=1 Tax=Streptomyces umbrinus TaxID=67370 RepID=UPI003420868D
MLELSGGHLPDPDAAYGWYPQPPLGAGHSSVVYDPRPVAAAEARAEVRRRLEGWGLAEQSDTAELLVSELVTNSLIHAASRLRLTLSAAHGVLRCEVSEAGRRPAEVPREGAVAGAAVGGCGMFLVDALARRWGCHQDGPGRTLWFELGTCGSDGCGRRQP